MKRLKRLKKSLWGGVAASALTLGIVTVPLAPAAMAAEPADGCSYGTGGPLASALCWIDMSALNFEEATSTAGQKLSLNLPGNTLVTTTVHITKPTVDTIGGEDTIDSAAPRPVDASAFPTYGGAVLGNGFYKGVNGKPALWTSKTPRPDGTGWEGWVDHIELSDISVTKAGVPYSDYSFVMADAESTDSGSGNYTEKLAFNSDVALTSLGEAQPEGWTKACEGGLVFSSDGKNAVCNGGPEGSGYSAGAALLQANSPKTVSIDMRVRSNSRQAVAFALSFTSANGSVSVDNNGGADGKFKLDTSVYSDGATTPLDSTSTDGSASNTGFINGSPIVTGTGKTPITYTLTHDGGTVPDGYNRVWTCTVNDEPVNVNPIMVDGRETVSVDVEANDVANCDVKLVSDPPKANPDTVTINPGETATLDPVTTPGKGKIEDLKLTGPSATADGKTAVVPNEGTWTIEEIDGKQVPKFTPIDDTFTGPVTQQPYTVVDEYGLTASSTLDVNINAPLKTGDDKVYVDQGATANLAPKTTQGTGEIKKAVFDNSENTKVVDGQGTWKIELEDGQPKATFTPADGFTGPVTTQVYTVSDSNGLKASGKLDVIIRPKTGDDKTTVNQGDTAYLTPEAKPGSSKITGATFDNGQSTKEVPNEGTWTIAIVDGQPRAQFEPATRVDGKPFSGPVTPQTYTIIDKYSEEDVDRAPVTGKLEVFIRPETGDDAVVVKQGDTAELNPESTPGSAPIVSAAFDNGSETKVVAGEGTWTISVVNGQPVAKFVPDANFNGPVTPQAYTVTDGRGETATGNLSVIVLPETGDDTVIVAQGESATLNPSAKPGSADIVSAHFENGESTLVVPGEGTWKVYVVNGQPEATFVPEAGFTGPVTSQDYTVVDENDEDATGTLNVIIKPETGDDSVTIGVNETANLEPETAPGSGEITKAVFDNNETTKVVTGQGTWTIELVDGQPKATFTPEKDYNGPVDSQKYTVTDENNLTASGTLRVTIRDPKISLVKTANPTTVDKAGEEITYTFKVTNTGNLPLTNVTVDDKDFEGSGKLGEITPASVDLKPNETKEFTAKYTVTQEDIDNGAFKNVATSTGETPEDPNNPGHDPEDPVSPPDDETVTPVQDPKISVTKKADKQKVQKAGEKIVYTFVATNTGNVTLKDVKINDDTEAFTGTGELSEPVCEVGAKSLAPGESVNCTADYTVTEDDLKTEKIHNVATATGDAPGDPNDPDNPGPENPVSPPADEDVPTEPVTDVPVVKTVTGPKGNEVQKDDKATFQIKATWKDVLGTEQEQIINVTPGKPVDLKDLPKNTEITLSEVGAETSVSNIKWGDIIWSGAGVTDATGDSPEAKVILEGDGPFAIDLENQTSSNGLIIIPIPIPLPNGGGSSNPPTPNNPDNPSNPSNPDNPENPSTSQEPGKPGTGEKGNTPGGKGSAESPKKGGGLANTGANVALLAGGAILLLIGGAWLVLRGRKEES